MCIACKQYSEGKIDGKTALKKLQDAIKVEMNPDHIGDLTKHMFELSEIILAKEVPQSETDEQTEKDWWNHTHSED